MWFVGVLNKSVVLLRVCLGNGFDFLYIFTMLIVRQTPLMKASSITDETNEILITLHYTYSEMANYDFFVVSRCMVHYGKGRHIPRSTKKLIVEEMKT